MHHQQSQQQQPPFRNNNNLESLKILTSELAENLGNGSGLNGSSNGGRHHDSGYISPNLPPASGSGGKVFFDGNNPPHPGIEHQPPPVDPVLLQQVLQQQHPKQQQQQQQPMINHRPITGKLKVQTILDLRDLEK